MDLHGEQRYSAPVEKLFALYTDEDFLTAMSQDGGATDVHVDVRRDGDSATVVTTRMEAVDVPSFARRILSDRMPVTQTEEWEPPSGDGRRGTWKVSVKGVPSSMGGTYLLTADAQGARLVIDGQVKVSVPLIGGKLEKTAAEAFESSLRRQHEFTERRLAGG